MSSLSQTLPFVFVGTYTEHEGSQSKGIYVYQMDPASGRLNFRQEVRGVRNPSYLALHPHLNFLYAVNELQDSRSESGGGVSTFSMDADGIKFLNQQASRGSDPCYVSLERSGRFALVANYTSGSVAMLPIQSDGQLGPASDVVQHTGSSVHPERQTGPHAHCILPDPTNHFAIAVDLGLDKLIVYRLDLENGKLHRHREVDVQPGAGPRHLVFHPNHRFAYLINELNATLTWYRYEPGAGALEELQTLPALPSDFDGQNLCADIHVSPDGNYLYASNRGHDSIVCYFVDQKTGELVFRNHTHTGGREPRNFAIDPSGNFLLAANQKTNSIVTFQIDARTGQLNRTEYEAEVSMPVCIKFLHQELEG
jgi:6-phosphogluconolactonase